VVNIYYLEIKERYIDGETKSTINILTKSEGIDKEYDRLVRQSGDTHTIHGKSDKSPSFIITAYATLDEAVEAAYTEGENYDLWAKDWDNQGDNEDSGKVEAKIKARLRKKVESKQNQGNIPPLTSNDGIAKAKEFILPSDPVQQAKNKATNKKIFKVFGIAAAVLFVIIIIAVIFTDEPTDDPIIDAQASYENTTADTSIFVLPSEADFLADITSRFYENYSAGEFTIDTILARPVEFEISRFELNANGRPVIGLWANVSEYYAGAVTGAIITTEAVFVVLEWLIEQGFNPHRDWLMPSATVRMAEIGATGQRMWRVWGTSSYNFNTDTINWYPQ
jgi:hypothetical protein